MLPISAALHQRLGLACLLYAVLVGIWGTFQLARRQSVSSSLRAAFLLMIALTAVQGLIGIVAFAAGGRPRELLHIVYGIFAIIFLPGAVLFASAQGRQGSQGRQGGTPGANTPLREAAILAGACWIVAIAFGRGILTGQ
ncbi:MAG: hypothetical protein M3024_04720 [Candidatus Dormibacteraeota bacterium]|nr:hypothetical protein [Candidatus Dormibacteraeota bacterium]